jgi:hypothetical protein
MFIDDGTTFEALSDEAQADIQQALTREPGERAKFAVYVTPFGFAVKFGDTWLDMQQDAVALNPDGTVCEAVY